jgi:capsular polysaccharide biosynthesis protein
VALLSFVHSGMAQGVSGIDAASSELTTYVDPIGTLIIVIGAIVGLVGGVRVFIKWNTGDQDVQKSLMGWLGSCVFLMLVGVVVKAFFGV